MHRKVGRRWASYARAPKRISYIDVEPCMHKTAGARDNMNSIYARTCTRVHRFDMTRARMCDIWLAACVLRWGRGFFPGARARTQIRAQPRLRYCCRHALHPVWACRHLEHPNLVGCRAAVAALAAFVAATAAAKRSFTWPLRSGRKDASFMISDTLLVKLALFFVGAAAAAAGAAATAAAGLRLSTTRFCGAAFCFACCAGAPWRTGFTGAALNACCTAAVAIAVAGSLAAAAAAPRGSRGGPDRLARSAPRTQHAAHESEAQPAGTCSARRLAAAGCTAMDHDRGRRRWPFANRLRHCRR